MSWKDSRWRWLFMWPAWFCPHPFGTDVEGRCHRCYRHIEESK